MMRSPACPDHGSLVLDLALGRLDEAEALCAEQARSHCELCGEWWSENLEGEVVAAVHMAVGDVISSLDVPRRHRPHAWWVAAAAAVVVLSVGLTWRLGPSSTPAGASRTASVEGLATAEVGISGFDFESGRAAVTQRSVRLVPQPGQVTRAAGQEDPAEAVFTGGFESSGLEVWTSDT